MAIATLTRIVDGLGLIVLLVACNSPTPTVAPTRIPSIVQTSTATPIPLPTSTVAPTMTSTPRPMIIEPGNVAQIRIVANWQSLDGDWIKQLVWSPDNQIIAALENQRAVLRQVASGQVLQIIKGPSDSMSISPDGHWLAAGLTDDSVRLWEVSSGREVLNLGKHSSMVKSVPFSLDGRLLFAGSIYGPQKIWDVVSGRQASDLGTQVGGVVLSAAFSPDGKLLAVGTGSSRGGGIELWDVASVQVVARLFDARDDKYSVAFSPDGTLLASGSLYGYVKLWNITDKREAITLQVPQSSINSVAFSPKGDLLAVATSEGIRLVQVSNGNTLRLLTGHTRDVYSAVFSPDGKFLASGSQDGAIKLWSIQP